MRSLILSVQRLNSSVHRFQIRDLDIREQLGFELVRQDQVSVFEQVLVHRNRVFCHVDAAVVAHDGVEDPEESPRRGFLAELAADFADFLDESGGRAVAGEHHVEVVEVGVFEAGVEGGDFFGGGFAAVEAFVGYVVTWRIVRSDTDVGMVFWDMADCN
jgi:hypothetical protein